MLAAASRGFVNGCHIDTFFQKREDDSERRLRRPASLTDRFAIENSSFQDDTTRFLRDFCCLTAHDTCKGYWLVCDSDNQVIHVKSRSSPSKVTNFSPARASRTRMSSSFKGIQVKRHALVDQSRAECSWSHPLRY